MSLSPIIRCQLHLLQCSRFQQAAIVAWNGQVPPDSCILVFIFQSKLATITFFPLKLHNDEWRQNYVIVTLPSLQWRFALCFRLMFCFLVDDDNWHFSCFLPLFGLTNRSLRHPCFHVLKWWSRVIRGLFVLARSVHHGEWADVLTDPSPSFQRNVNRMWDWRGKDAFPSLMYLYEIMLIRISTWTPGMEGCWEQTLQAFNHCNPFPRQRQPCRERRRGGYSCQWGGCNLAA